MANAILKALNAEHVAEGYDRSKHRIVVKLDGGVVAQITPSAPGCQDRLQTVPGDKAIGPVFDLDQMRRTICRVVFAGDVDAMGRAEVARERR